MNVLYLKKLDNPKELIRPSGGVILLFISLRGILALLEMFGVGDGEEIRESGKESSALFSSASASTKIKNKKIQIKMKIKKNWLKPRKIILEYVELKKNQKFIRIAKTCVSFILSTTGWGSLLKIEQT